MKRTLLALLVLAVPILGACASAPTPTQPYLLVLGTAQDAGSPQINSPAGHPARLDPSKRRYASCVAIVDPRDGTRYLIDATPDLREQAWMLSRAAPDADEPIRIDGIFLSHAHIGHYTGLMYLGHESMGAKGVPVHAMPRMSDFLRANGPWSQLVDYGNIELRTMSADEAVRLADDLTVTPILVPHRQEYAEVVGFLIEGPGRSVLYVPDIDSWDQWSAMGTTLEEIVARVDIALLDATFFDNNEIPGRDMSAFPHPRITETMRRLQHLSRDKRANIGFIHLNHTNPAQWKGTPERREIERRGFAIPARGDVFAL